MNRLSSSSVCKCITTSLYELIRAYRRKRRRHRFFTNDIDYVYDMIHSVILIRLCRFSIHTVQNEQNFCHQPPSFNSWSSSSRIPPKTFAPYITKCRIIQQTVFLSTSELKTPIYALVNLYAQLFRSRHKKPSATCWTTWIILVYNRSSASFYMSHFYRMSRGSDYYCEKASVSYTSCYVYLRDC